MMEEFEVGTSALVRAFHVMHGAEGPEGEPHTHDYRVDVVVGRSKLDERGMVCDLDVLAGVMQELVGRLEGTDLDAIRPPSAEAVTVEVFARWAHEALSEPLRIAGGETLQVRVWESETAFGGYRAPIA